MLVQQDIPATLTLPVTAFLFRGLLSGDVSDRVLHQVQPIDYERRQVAYLSKADEWKRRGCSISSLMSHSFFAHPRAQVMLCKSFSC